MRISTTITGGRTAGNPSHLEAWRRRIYSSGRRVKIKDAIEKRIMMHDKYVGHYFYLTNKIKVQHLIAIPIQ